MKQFKLLLPVLAAMLLMVNCTKEGPQGPQGNAGPEGPQGPVGAPNVIYSGWLSFQQAERDTLIDGTNLKVNHIPAAQLNQAIIDNGIVLAYMRFGTTVLKLPYTSRAGARPNTVSFVPRPNVLYITRFTHDNVTPYLGFGSVQFRYVLVPGGVTAGRYAGAGEKRVTINGEVYTESQLKALSSEEISVLLNIPE